MSKCVEKIIHKACGKNGLQVFQKDGGGYDGWCFICNQYESNPYEDKDPSYKPTFQQKTDEEIAEEIGEIATYPTLSISSRKLKKEYLEYYGIKTAVSEEDGITPTAAYLPYHDENGKHIGYKVRLLSEKRMWAVGTTRGASMFGWDLAKNADGPRLYITEGEFDAVALFQVMKDKNKDKPQFAAMNPPVVSLPAGSGSTIKTLVRYLPDIRKRFKEVVLVFDNDEAGKKAVEEALKIIPDALVAELPAKDANDCIMEGKSNALFAAVRFNAQKPKNTRLVMAGDVIEDARKEAAWGASYPYKSLTDLTRGQRFGECVYWGAGVKMGKSEFLNDLVAWNIKEHGWKCFVAKTEESNSRTLQGVVGKIAGKIFHDPKIEFDYEAFDDAVPIVADNLMMLNLYQELTWDVLKGDIRAAAGAGCKAIFIDPITTLSNSLDPAEANTLLQRMAQELAQLAMDLQIVCHIYCHLKAPDNGKPHERGGVVQSQQFAGSRAMMRSCHAMIGIQGDKDPEIDEDSRNVRDLVLLEDRQSGSSGKVKVYYNNRSGTFNEI